VLIMTIHASKGLEYPVVFVTGLEENLFPDLRIGGGDIPEEMLSADQRAEIEEERRLAFVATTRAKQHLYLTNARGRMRNGQWWKNEPSRFLDEIPEHLISEVARAS